MQANSQETPHVPIARGAPVTDDMLEHIGRIGGNMMAGTVNADQMVLIAQNLEPIAKELLQRRKAMDLIKDVTDLDNVLFIPAGGAI